MLNLWSSFEAFLYPRWAIHCLASFFSWLYSLKYSSIALYKILFESRDISVDSIRCYPIAYRNCRSAFHYFYFKGLAHDHRRYRVETRRPRKGTRDSSRAIGTTSGIHTETSRSVDERMKNNSSGVVFTRNVFTVRGEKRRRPVEPFDFIPAPSYRRLIIILPKTNAWQNIYGNRWGINHRADYYNTRARESRSVGS